MDASLILHDRIADVRFLSMLRRGNVHGALDFGLAPGLLPGRVGLDEGRSRFTDAWPTSPTTRGRDAFATLQAAADGAVDVLVLLGADVLVDVPDNDLARRGIEGAGTVIALALFATSTLSLIHI